MNLKNECRKILGSNKRSLSKNSDIYTYDHPKDIIIFDALIVNKRSQLLWNGDLNLTNDHSSLIKLQKRIGDFYVFHKSAMIDNQSTTFTFSRSFCCYIESGFKSTEELEFVSIKKGIPFRKKVKPIKFSSNYPSFFEDKEYMFEKIKIPNLKSLFLNSKNKRGGFWEVLKNKMIELYGTEFVNKNFIKIYLTKKDYLTIKDKNQKSFQDDFVKKHPVEIKKMANLDEIQHAPLKFDKTINWAKNGFGYLKK